MEWVKDIIGMKYFWLIRNCFLFFCFRLSLLLGINSIFLSLLSLSLCLPHCFSVFFSILKVFSLYLSLFFWCSCILFLFAWCRWSFSLYFSNILYLNIWRPFVSSRWCSVVASKYSIQVRPTIHLLRQFLSFSIY